MQKKWFHITEAYRRKRAIRFIDRFQCYANELFFCVTLFHRAFRNAHTSKKRTKLCLESKFFLIIVQNCIQFFFFLFKLEHKFYRFPSDHLIFVIKLGRINLCSKRNHKYLSKCIYAYKIMLC